MNVHIFIDANGLYTNQTYERAKRISRSDIFINITDGQPKFVHSEIHYFPSDCIALFKFLETIEVKAVFFHYYNYASSYILKKIKRERPEITFVWVFWSADFYNLKEFLPALYLDYSKKYLPSYTLRSRLRNTLSVIKRTLFDQPHYLKRKFLKSVHNINYIACLLDEDYNNIVKYTKCNNCKRILFAYLPYDQLLPASSLHLTASGNKIMVNHSGDPTLNHYEILTLLHKTAPIQTILMMLSYGNANYIQELSDDAKKLFPENLEIITNFIDPQDYPLKLCEVGYAIFNSRIQQGIGNIILLLWLGVKVYLREENSVYIDFKKWNLHIFSIQSDLPKEQFKEKLSIQQIEHNRKILKEHLSSKKVDEYYQNLMTLNSVS